MYLEKIKDIIQEEKTNNESDKGFFTDIYNRKLVALTENLDKTIEFFDNCDEDEFYWTANAFDDISEKFQSQAFIECLRRNQKRFPAIYDEMEEEIEFAVNALKNNSNDRIDD